MPDDTAPPERTGEAYELGEQLTVVGRKLRPGDPAPDFELLTDDVANKTKVKLSALRGKKVVLLFYPMDFSPVCTAEHCAFGPEESHIAGSDGVIFGVSCDSPFSHAANRLKALR